MALETIFKSHYCRDCLCGISIFFQHNNKHIFVFYICNSFIDADLWTMFVAWTSFVIADFRCAIINYLQRCLTLDDCLLWSIKSGTFFSVGELVTFERWHFRHMSIHQYNCNHLRHELSSHGICSPKLQLYPIKHQFDKLFKSFTSVILILFKCAGACIEAQINLTLFFIISTKYAFVLSFFIFKRIQIRS